MNNEEYYLKLSKQIGISYFFSFLTIIFQPLLIIILTRVLSIEEFGIYSLLVVTISILTNLLRCGVESYIITKIPGLEEEKRIVTIITILFFFLMILMVCGLLLFIFKSFIINILNINNYTYIWNFVIPLIMFTTFFDIINYYLISIKKIFISSFFRFLIQCLWVIILFGFFLITGKFSLKIVFTIWLFNVFFLLSISPFLLKREIFYFVKKSLKIDFRQLKRILEFGLPLIIVAAFTLMVEYSDRFLINYFLDKTKVALYSLASSLVGFIIIAAYILQGVIQPYFNEKWNSKQDPTLLFNALIKYTMICILPAIIGMFILRKEIIILLSSPEYIPAAPLVVILLSYPIFNILSLIFTHTMYLRDMVKQLLIINLIAITINIILNLIFIPKIGIEAAAYSTVLSTFLVFILLVFYRPKNIAFQWDYLKIFRILLASISMGIIIYPIHPSLYWSKILVIILGAVIYSIFLFIFKVFTKEEKEMMIHIYKNITEKNIVLPYTSYLPFYNKKK